jgi:prolyl 4-hydroxylase
VQILATDAALFARRIADLRQKDLGADSELLDQRLHRVNNPNEQPWRLYNVNGQLVTSFAGITSVTFLVPGGKLFIWPAVPRHTAQVDPFNNGDPADWPHAKVEMTTISTDPRIFEIKNFITDEECDELIAVSRSNIRRSTTGIGKGMKNSKRTSENAFDDASEVALRLKRRAFQLLRIEWNKHMADGLQVLRYSKAQAYSPHTDFFGGGVSDEYNWDPAQNGTNRFATILLYLTDVALGGETVFPLAGDRPPVDAAAPPGEALTQLSGWELEMANVCATKLAVKPMRARAILFYSQDTSGKLLMSSLHGGCPVIEGDKWAANLWVWNADRFGTEAVTLCFENTRSTPVFVYYESAVFATIAPAAKTCYTSYHGQAWQMRDQDDLIITEYKACTRLALEHTPSRARTHTHARALTLTHRPTCVCVRTLCTHRQSRTRRHTHTTCTRSPQTTHTPTDAPSHAHARAHSPTHARTAARAPACACTRMHTHTHALGCTRTRMHAHARTTRTTPIDRAVADPSDALQCCYILNIGHRAPAALRRLVSVCTTGAPKGRQPCFAAHAAVDVRVECR